MRLPGEEELRDLIRADLASEFQVASELLRIGVGIFRPTVCFSPEGGMEDSELWICLGVIARACRQYRAIIALAEISLGDVSEANGRMLLETMLTANFLMRSEVTLKRGEGMVTEVEGYPLTRAFRTKLYLAHHASSTLKTLRGMAASSERKCENVDRVLHLAETDAREHSNEIGAEWTTRLKKSQTFSGVSIYDLAKSMDMLYVYNFFYRPASAGVHGSNASRYIEVHEQDDGDLMFSTVSSEKGVAEALAVSSLVMLDILNVSNQRLGLHLDEQLSDIAPRVQQMAHRINDE